MGKTLTPRLGSRPELNARSKARTRAVESACVEKQTSKYTPSSVMARTKQGPKRRRGGGRSNDSTIIVTRPNTPEVQQPSQPGLSRLESLPDNVLRTIFLASDNPALPNASLWLRATLRPNVFTQRPALRRYLGPECRGVYAADKLNEIRALLLSYRWVSTDLLRDAFPDKASLDFACPTHVLQGPWTPVKIDLLANLVTHPKIMYRTQDMHPGSDGKPVPWTNPELRRKYCAAIFQGLCDAVEQQSSVALGLLMLADQALFTWVRTWTCTSKLIVLAITKHGCDRIIVGTLLRVSYEHGSAGWKVQDPDILDSAEDDPELNHISKLTMPSPEMQEANEWIEAHDGEDDAEWLKSIFWGGELPDRKSTDMRYILRHVKRTKKWIYYDHVNHGWME